MAELAYAEIMQEESSDYVDLMEYLEGVEEDISELGLIEEQTEQLRTENESLENRGLETMMTYFMILEEELTVEKQKVQRLQKVNQEITRERCEIEELNKDLIKQKHKLETENQQLRQKLWRVKDLFTKTTDELWQLRRQNRMLHEMLEMNKSPPVNGRRENENSQTLPRHERLERHSHQNISQCQSNLDDTNLNTSTSEPNIQRFSSLRLPRTDDICHKARNSLLQEFVTSNQARQNNNKVGDINTALEGKSKQHKHEAEEPCAKEKSVETNDTESIGYGTEECCTEEIPIMPAPLPKNLLILFDKDTHSNEKNEQPRDKDIKKLEERNSHLTKILQKLEMHCHHDCLNSRYQAMKQTPVDQTRTEMPKKARKGYPKCNAKEEELLKAVKACSLIRVRQVISEGVDVNVALLGKWTPLHIAAALGFVYICEELLDAGALKHAKDRWGDTPLHWAAVNGCQEVASLLVQHGDDVFKRGRDNKTPREKALAAGHNDLADWFAKKEQEQRKSSTEA